MVRVSTAALALACSHVAPVVGFAPLSVGGRGGSLGSVSHNRLAASRGYRIAAKKGRELAVVSDGRGEVGRRNRINRVLEGGGGGVAALGGLVGVLFAVYGVVVAALAGTVGALFGLYYGKYLVEQPRLMYTQTAAAKAVIETWKPPAYHPTFWAVNPHLQIIVQLIKEKLLTPPLEEATRKEIEFADGEKGALHYIFPAESPRTAPTVLYVPGITSTAQSVSSFMRAATARGWKSAAIDRRAHVGPLQQSPAFNIMGCTHDLRTAISRLR